MLKSSDNKRLNMWLIFSCLLSGVLYLLHKNIILGSLFLLVVLIFIINSYCYFHNKAKENKKD